MNDEIKLKLERLKKLKSGQGTQYVLNEAYNIMGHPMLMHDMSYKIIAYTEGVRVDDPIWKEYVTYGTVGREVLEFFKQACFIDDAANANKITFMICDALPFDRIFGKVYNKLRIPVANLIAIACEKKFAEGDAVLFEAVCDLLTQEMGRMEFYHNYGVSYQAAIIKKLIEGSIEDRALYAGHVANIDEGMKSHLYIALADIGRCDPSYESLPHFRNLLNRAQNAFKYAIYQNHIVIILSSRYARLHVNKDLSKLNRLFAENNIYAGISSAFENLFELPKYYEQARQTLEHGLNSNGRQWIFLYNEVFPAK